MWHRIGVSRELGKVVPILSRRCRVLATNYSIFDGFVVCRTGFCISCGQFYFLSFDLASQGPPSSSNAIVYVSSSHRIFGCFCLCDILQNVSFQATWTFKLHPILLKWVAIQIWCSELAWKQCKQLDDIRRYVPSLLLHCLMHRPNANASKAILDKRESGSNLYRCFNIIFIHNDDSYASIAARPLSSFSVYSKCNCVAGICCLHRGRCSFDCLCMH